MKKFRILVIDEEVLTRQAVARLLRQEPNLEIKVCPDKNNAVELVKNDNPDILILNIEDGKEGSYTSFDSLRAHYPELPVIVLTSRTESGAGHALYALRNGAMDFITKPEQHSNLLFANRHLVKRLRPSISAAAKKVDKKETEREISEILKGVQKELEKGAANRLRGRSPCRLITIGASIGGPQALFSLLPELPRDLPVPVVIVQHFPRHYTRELALNLDNISYARVEEAYDGAVLTPGTIWIAPGGFQCEIIRKGTGSVLKVHRGPRENGMRPSISLLFRSATKVFDSGVMGIILSGSGSDGLAGAKSVIERGGVVFVQDPHTALVPALPLSVIEAGLTDSYYPVPQLAARIIERSGKMKEVQGQE